MKNIIFINANVYTMERDMPFATAIVTNGDKIKYVGVDSEALKYKRDGDEVIDAHGKMILPGFIDAHCHPMLAAFWLSGLCIDIDLNREEVLECIKGHIEENPDKPNYFGIGYAEWIYDEKGPNKSYLDELCQDKPIFLLGSSGHEGWCNSKALEILNITKETPDPLPGFQYFERDGEGNPTGHVVESGASKILMNGIEWFDPERIEKILGETFDAYSRMGVTSLVDCGTLTELEELAIQYLGKYETEGRLKQRICSCVMVEDRAKLDKAIPLLEKRSKEYCSDEYFISTLKILNDGTIESRTASLFEPYDEDGSEVNPMVTIEELQELCVEAASKGHDIHIHAIGDRGIYYTLMAAKAVREAGFHETRITNAHTDFVREQDNRLFGKYNVIANTTCVWHYGNPEMNKLIGEREDQQFRMQSIIKEGARMSLGSDHPVDEYGAEPLKGIQMGVTRQIYSDTSAPILQPESEKLSIQQCIEGYTIHAAYQMHMDHKIGSLSAGKYADIVVVEKDIFEIPILEIYKTDIAMTMKAGTFTYRK